MRAIGMLKDKPGIHSFELEKPKLQRPKDVLIRLIQAGICGTDRSMVKEDRKDLPRGEDRLILGHEAMGIVEDCGSDVAGLKAGDYVVPTVRRGCGQCASCANNQSDMCETGLFKERGIHKLHGFFTEYGVDEEKYVVSVPKGLEPLAVLTEPLSIGVKTLELIELIQSRYPWACPPNKKPSGEAQEWGWCKNALVFGAGPIGFLLVCLFRLGGVNVSVLENKDEDQPRVQLLKKLGARYIDSRTVQPEEVGRLTGPLDIIVEATGVSEYALRLISALGRNGIYVFTGLPRGSSTFQLDGNQLLRQTVRLNQVIVGTVNANRSHFEEALKLLSEMNNRFPDVLNRVITRRVAFRDFETVKKMLEERDRLQIKEVLDISQMHR